MQRQETQGYHLSYMCDVVVLACLRLIGDTGYVKQAKCRKIKLNWNGVLYFKMKEKVKVKLPLLLGAPGFPMTFLAV